MMNPLNKKKDSSKAPDNLPHEPDVSSEEKGENLNVSFSISKKQLKTAGKIIIVLLILAIATPRIVSNIKSTANVVDEGASAFPRYFPTLSQTGSAIGSFFVDSIKDASNFITDSLASVANILYTRKVPEVDISGEITEETARPVKLVIDKIGINTRILNPESTDLVVLDEALKYGAVRYPKSGLLGEKDNVYIFGHSTNWEVVQNQAYKALNNLEKLEVGDTIKVQSQNKEHLYKVTSVRTEKDSEAVVKFNTGKRTLTISTCNTLGAKEDRHIVEAEFVISYNIAKEDDNSNNNSEDNSTKEPTNNNNTGGAISPGEEQEEIIPLPNGDSGIRPSNPHGQADLVSEITKIGILNDSGEFIASSTPSAKSKIAFKFIVSNKGTKTSESWEFNVVLPTEPVHIYHSNSQMALKPGEKIEYAMGFDQAAIGEDLALIVNVNPAGSTNERTRDNNIAKKLITIVE